MSGSRPSQLTAFGLVVLMMISRYVMQFRVDLYAQDYGGFGVVLAFYFWIALSSAGPVFANVPRAGRGARAV